MGKITTLALAVLPLTLVAFAHSQEPIQGSPSQELRMSVPSEVDVHNFLVMRLRLLRRGFPVEDLKTEITNDIDFGAVTKESEGLFRRLLTLYDHALEEQGNLDGEVAVLRAKVDRANAKALESIGTAVFTGGVTSVTGFLSLLDSNSDADDAVGAQKTLAKRFAVSLGADISSFEFDLSLLRSRVLKDNPESISVFVTGSDYDAFLSAKEQKDDAARLAGVLAALERSPRLQPSALYLADGFFRKGDIPNCRKYAEIAAELSPGILRRDALRAQAIHYQANLLLRDKQFASAAATAERGLSDDPAHKGLLATRAEGLALDGKHAEALPIFEKLVILVPQQPVILYNLACCQVVASKNVDAALRALTESLAAGFTDIAHAKVDPDLDELRNTRADAFTALTQMRLDCTIGWNLINSDELVVTNTSAFTLTKVEITAEVQIATQNTPSGPPIIKTFQRTFALPDLAPKGTRRFGLLDTTKGAFRNLHITAIGPQGSFEVARTAADLGLNRSPK